MLLSFTTIKDGDILWYYVTINGVLDRFGYSSAPAAARRLLAIRDGWL